jgi:hypothetical protein
MPITRLLKNGVFEPKQITEITAAFESVLAALGLVDRADPVVDLIAKAIIDCAKTGEVDRRKLHDCAIATVTRS